MINSSVCFLGWSLGEHQEWSKYSNFEVALQVPLIIHVPGLRNNRINSHRKAMYDRKNNNSKMYRHNENYSATNSMVELVDIFPTLAELSGIEVPKLCPCNSSKVMLCTEGSSLVPLIKCLSFNNGNKHVKWKSAVFSQFPRPSDLPQENSDQPRLRDIRIMGYTMRTELYRYTEWVGFDPITLQTNWSDLHARELYVHTTDPSEDNNVADLPHYKQTVTQLSATLHQGWRNALPKFE